MGVEIVEHDSEPLVRILFDHRVQKGIRDGRTAPTPCTVAYNYQCEGLDPAYLASGALTYVIQRLSRSGAARASLVAWQAGRRTILLSFPAGCSPVLRHDRAGPGDLGQRHGPAKRAMDDLALVRRRPGRDRRPPAAGRVAVLRGRGDRLVSAAPHPARAPARGLQSQQ